jgi:hypothetical protein
MSPLELASTKAAALTDAAQRRAAEAALVNFETTLETQCGVVDVYQLAAVGLGKHDVVRLRRRNCLRRVHPRVYVTHTGPLTRAQQIWAALLAAAPAVLCGPTLMDPAAEGDVHVAIDASRRVRPLTGVRLHRVRGLDAVAQWRAQPPRMRREDNVLALVAEASDELAVVRLLTDAARDRNIGVGRLREALGRRTRLRRRTLVLAVLDDIETGAQSVLEWAYLHRVERAHGLPTATRQAMRRTAGGKQYRDLEYAAWALVVELDGRLNHDSWEAESRDADRDLDEAAGGGLTIRLRWGQVFGTPCATARRLASVLRVRGWSGSAVPCGPGCHIVEPESR